MRWPRSPANVTRWLPSSRAVVAPVRRFIVGTKMLRRGAVLLSLTLWCASCASDPVVEYRTVEVKVPVVVPVPTPLTDVPAEPKLPAGSITNEDLADHIDALRAWGRGIAGKLRKIAGLQTEPPK